MIPRLAICALFVAAPALAQTVDTSQFMMDAMSARVDAFLTETCGGTHATPAWSLMQADLDRDGAPDYLLPGANASCGGSSPLCDEGSCEIVIFLSSQELPHRTLRGINPGITFDPDGQPGLMLDVFNGPLLTWDGSRFVADQER